MVYISSFLKVRSFSFGCYVYMSPSVIIGCVLVSVNVIWFLAGQDSLQRFHVSPSDPRAYFALVPSVHMDSIKVQFQRESGRVVWPGSILESESKRNGMDTVGLKMLQSKCQKTVCELEL